MVLGLTGGIATGKSTVSRMLQNRGAVIIDADQTARDVVKPGTEGYRKVRERFGDDVFGPEGFLNRKALREIVFRDANARKDLNEILHPLIIRKMKEEVDRWKQADVKHPIVLDVPLLIEENLTDLVDSVVVVYIPEELQLKRLMDREGISADEARRMIKAQMPIEDKKVFADVLIDNSGSRADTERQVDALWQTSVSKSGSARL
ncbi:dephospho-CoA kinase [Melghirimyces algeriensis]|uniref:Dephospho-CoA kinase n=1 Tax=Melghirimyces algeriensis TaxID=910412 RepID=A0A521AHI8_9BACL|nr:dephospho-CoA kinase [Melghirimyces algeriensis]SMO34218.1 dephospho-CoA kinase [Melghirimyces algeriensis]